MAKFASLIFDLDGTLSDSVPMILRSSQATHERLGLPWSEEAAKKYIGRPMYETAAEFAPGREEEYRTIFAEYNMLYIPKMIRGGRGIIRYAGTGGGEACVIIRYAGTAGGG